MVAEVIFSEKNENAFGPVAGFECFSLYSGEYCQY